MRVAEYDNLLIKATGIDGRDLKFTGPPSVMEYAFLRRHARESTALMICAPEIEVE